MTETQPAASEIPHGGVKEEEEGVHITPSRQENVNRIQHTATRLYFKHTEK